MTVSFVGMLGFPGSGQSFMANTLKLVGLKIGHDAADLNGIATWRVLPELLPKERISRAPSKEGRKRRVGEEFIEFSHVFHLMRNPWNAIAEAAATLNPEDFDILKQGAKIHSRMPATSCQNWESKVKVLTIAFPVWYDKVRELDPDMMFRVDRADWGRFFKTLGMDNPFTLEQPPCLFKPEIKPVTYAIAGGLAGHEWASRVEVIARNLKY